MFHLGAVLMAVFIVAPTQSPAAETKIKIVLVGDSRPGANPAARVKWSRQSTDAEAGALTVENIFHGSDGWKPAVGKQD